MENSIGIVIAINESSSDMCEDQVKKLADEFNYDFYTEYNTETSDKIKELMESAHSEGFRNIVYLTEESQVNDIQAGLEEDYSHMFESILVLPENFHRLNFSQLKEAVPAPQTAQVPVQPVQQPVRNQPVQPTPVRQPVSGKPERGFLFIIPTNLPLIGTKDIIQKALKIMKGNHKAYIVPVPSTGTSVNPKTQITNGTVARAVWSLQQDKGGCELIEDTTIASSTFYSCLAHKDKNFNGSIFYKIQNYQKVHNIDYVIVSSKEICDAADTYGMTTYPVCENIPNEGNNQKIFGVVTTLFNKFTTLFKNKDSLDKYAKEKKLGQCPETWQPASDDKAILTIIEEIYAVSLGKKDPLKNSLMKGSDGALSNTGYQDFINALGALIPERDKELAKEWVKDTVVGEYVLDGAKAIKNAYNQLNKDKNPSTGEKGDKTYTHKQKQVDQEIKFNWTNLQVQYLLVNSEDFQNIKNYFDKGFYLV